MKLWRQSPRFHGRGDRLAPFQRDRLSERPPPDCIAETHCGLEESSRRTTASRIRRAHIEPPQKRNATGRGLRNTVPPSNLRRGTRYYSSDSSGQPNARLPANSFPSCDDSPHATIHRIRLLHRSRTVIQQADRFRLEPKACKTRSRRSREGQPGAGGLG